MKKMKQTKHYFATDIQNLKTVLDQQHIHLLEMLAILQQEHQALGNNNLDQFEIIVKQKNQQIKNLEQIQPLLSTVEKTVGGVLSKSTFSAFIQRMPDGKEKAEMELLWKKFQETLNQCNMQNKINNRILNASTTNLKQALNILRGNTDLSTSNIYSKTGQQQDKPHGQSIAVA
ncbi:MAG TPA: flagellar protein FlgN [Gammaproteobacteria bacterium]|nr:flagellar protein FlgN [Gammaproteobacteria bacterium]